MDFLEVNRSSQNHKIGYSYRGDSVVLDEATKSGFTSVRKHVARESGNPVLVLNQGHMSSSPRCERPYVRGGYALQLFGNHGEVDKVSQLKASKYYSAMNPLAPYWWKRICKATLRPNREVSMRRGPSKFHDIFARAAASDLDINQSHGLTLGVAGGSCEGSMLFGKQRFPQEIAKLILPLHGPNQPNQFLYFPP